MPLMDILCHNDIYQNEAVQPDWTDRLSVSVKNEGNGPTHEIVSSENMHMLVYKARRGMVRGWEPHSKRMYFVYRNCRHFLHNP